MSDLDFSKPAQGQPAQGQPAPGAIYNPAVAFDFFRSAGKPESFAQGETIFAEKEKGSRILLKRDKMYVVVQGEVNLVVGNKVIAGVKLGEIFGEMGVIGQATRSATAVAKTACTVIGLDDKQYLSALQQKPEFALMLMSIMIGRLRDTIARLGASGALPTDGTGKESAVFDKKLLAGLARLMADQGPVRYDRGKVIMQEGQTGAFMYVVLEGRIAISIQGSVVERIGPGGVFGEMALVDQSPRAASALAEADCALLAINRNTFLNLVKTSPAFGASLLGALAERARFMASRSK